jgi:putative transposase
VPGLLHHVFARGSEKTCIYADDHDYHSFLELLATTLSRFGVRCAAYCLLWNHYHLLLVPNEHGVSRLLQQLNSAKDVSIERV